MEAKGNMYNLIQKLAFLEEHINNGNPPPETFKTTKDIQSTKEKIPLKPLKFDNTFQEGLSLEDESPKVKKCLTTHFYDQLPPKLPFLNAQSLDLQVSSKKTPSPCTPNTNIFYKNSSPQRKNSFSASRYSTTNATPSKTYDDQTKKTQIETLPDKNRNSTEIPKKENHDIEKTNEKISSSSSFSMSKKLYMQKIENLKKIKMKAHTEIQRLRSKLSSGEYSMVECPNGVDLVKKETQKTSYIRGGSWKDPDSYKNNGQTEKADPLINDLTKSLNVTHNKIYPLDEEGITPLDSIEKKSEFNQDKRRNLPSMPMSNSDSDCDSRSPEKRIEALTPVYDEALNEDFSMMKIGTNSPQASSRIVIFM
ncbi:hypothetical protein SteCoe_1201 [Stentor coeruleus]|uniref:Uncharacterized protein n=1 Tax=Stentor coeruleus TaxID=5963 RepID=A0A1R2D2E5_9CILI|nr:hypothetical protein SteCoe_1201 [Stentor coeruleus]